MFVVRKKKKKGGYGHGGYGGHHGGYDDHGGYGHDHGYGHGGYHWEEMRKMDLCVAQGLIVKLIEAN